MLHIIWMAYKLAIIHRSKIKKRIVSFDFLTLKYIFVFFQN